MTLEHWELNKVNGIACTSEVESESETDRVKSFQDGWTWMGERYSLAI